MIIAEGTQWVNSSHPKGLFVILLSLVVLSELFNKIKPWETKDVDWERLIWIKCYGVPCHAWSEDFFEKLGLTYDVFMYVDEHTKDKDRLDVGRFVIKTTHHTVINEVVKVKIINKIFDIKLVEAA